MAGVGVGLMEEVIVLCSEPVNNSLEFGEGSRVFPLSMESKLGGCEGELGINEEGLKKLRELDRREE